MKLNPGTHKISLAPFSYLSKDLRPTLCQDIGLKQMSVQIREVAGQKKPQIHLLRSLFLVLLSTNLARSPKNNVILWNKMLSSPSLYGWEIASPGKRSAGKALPSPNRLPSISMVSGTCLKLGRSQVTSVKTGAGHRHFTDCYCVD